MTSDLPVTHSVRIGAEDAADERVTTTRVVRPQLHSAVGHHLRTRPHLGQRVPARPARRAAPQSHRDGRRRAPRRHAGTHTRRQLACGSEPPLAAPRHSPRARRVPSQELPHGHPDPGNAAHRLRQSQRQRTGRRQRGLHRVHHWDSARRRRRQGMAAVGQDGLSPTPTTCGSRNASPTSINVFPSSRVPVRRPPPTTHPSPFCTTLTRRLLAQLLKQVQASPTAC